MGAERVLREFLSYRTPAPLFLPKGQGFNGKSLDTPVVLPTWLSEEDVKHYTSKFEQKGFTGGLNYYRNLDRYVFLPCLFSLLLIPAAAD